VTATTSYILLAVSIIIAVAGQLFFKSASIRLNETGFDVKSILTNYQLILGLFLYFVSAMIYILSLKHVPLSVAYPSLAAGYVLVVALSALIYHEPVSSYKIAGIIFILIGVSLIWK